MKQKSTLTLETFLPYRLSVLTNRISALIATAYSESFGLRIPEWRAIAVLGETPGLTSKEITKRTAMDKVTVSRTVQTLLDKELIWKTPSDTDGRVAHLHLSDEGEVTYLKIVPMALQYESQLLEILDPQERDSLDVVLRKLHSGLEELEQAAGMA